MTSWFSNYSWTTLILFGLAIIIMAVLLVTNRGDLTSATLLLIAFASFIIGLLIFLLEHDKGADQKLAASMVFPYTSTVSRILADLGVQGHAHFITVPENLKFPARVMQFNPVISVVPERVGENQTFYMGKDSPGLLTVPSGNSLLEMMEDDNSIILPSSDPKFLEAIKEVNLDLLEIVDNVFVTRFGNEIVVDLKNFKLIEGCIKIRDESPQNCLTAPCPICSLVGIIIARGLGKTCMIQGVVVDMKRRNVEIHIEVKEPVLGDVKKSGMQILG